MRAITSTPPPAPNGSIMRTGLVGYSCVNIAALLIERKNSGAPNLDTELALVKAEEFGVGFVTWSPQLLLPAIAPGNPCNDSKSTFARHRSRERPNVAYATGAHVMRCLVVDAKPLCETRPDHCEPWVYLGRAEYTPAAVSAFRDSSQNVLVFAVLAYVGYI